MCKLLSADFARMKKNKFFWLGIAFMVFVGIMTPVMNYIDMIQTKNSDTLEGGFFSFSLLIVIVSAIFSGLYLGTEYSDGTIRNKIIVGHKRWGIYLSNLIVCTVSGIIMCLAFIAVYLGVGIPLFGGFHLSAQHVVTMVLGIFVMSLAFAGIFTMIAMLNQNKAVAAVACIMSAFLLLCAGVYINASLNEPETYSGYVMMENGHVTKEEEKPNAHYLRGTKREVYEFLYDFLPGGQAMQFSEGQADHIWQMMLYSGIVLAGTTGAGLILFKRKNLK